MDSIILGRTELPSTTVFINRDGHLAIRQGDDTVVFDEDRAKDLVQLVQAFIERGEITDIPDSVEQ